MFPPVEALKQAELILQQYCRSHESDFLLERMMGGLEGHTRKPSELLETFCVFNKMVITWMQTYEGHAC